MKTWQAKRALTVLAVLAACLALNGCYVVPAQTNDFSELRDDALTAPIKKYIRSWDAEPRVDFVGRDLSNTFKGRPLSEFENLIIDHHGSCRRNESSPVSCSASFSWKTYDKRGLRLVEGPAKRLCLRYQVELAGEALIDVFVKATCFE